MDIVDLLVPADGVHIGVKPLADIEIIVFQREPLPLREGMHHLRGLPDRRDVEPDRTLHAVQIVVQARILPHEEGGGHAAQIELDGEVHLEGPLDIVDGQLGLVDGQPGAVVFGDEKHERFPF